MSFLSINLRQIVVESSNKDLLEAEHPLEIGDLLPVIKKLMPPPPAGTCTRLTKVLVNVTIERSFGPVHVIVSPESSVRELIKTAVEVYVKEKRRPLLADTNYRRFELHYSQFSLESIKAEEKLMNLGSRNFFLCAKTDRTVAANSLEEEESKETAISPFILYTRFMDFLL